jgi:Tfp pilus assembly ATPase PilU
VLRQIEKELVQHGFYHSPSSPDHPRRLSLAEVQRRAGLGSSFLRNPRHHDLREIVKDWLLVQQRGFSTSKKLGQGKKRDKISFYEDALAKASSEAQAWLIEKKRLKNEVAELKKSLKIASGRTNVVTGNFDANN